MTLQLNYAFLPSPNPILASADASNPATVTVQAMVSAPPTTTVSLTKIGIQIPVGQEGAGYLSSEPNLPDPVYDHSCGWTITSSGSWVTLTPSGGGTGQIGGSILFTLSSIPVCTSSGTVPIAVAEVPGSEVQKYASLVKWPSNFPVTDFHVDPPELYNLDESVTLYWNAIPDPAYVYSVYSDDWQPKDCLGAGDCYTAQDGVDGVVSPQLASTTSFWLDVVQFDSHGHPTIDATIETTAQVVVPLVSQNSYLETSTLGRLARAHWLASNAISCALSLDDEPLVTEVPLDTYSDGYLVGVPGPAGVRQLAVTATSQSGAKAPWPFLDFQVSDLTVSIGTPPLFVAITPDSSTALVVGPGSNGGILHLANLNFVDLPAGDVVTDPVKLLSVPTGLALQPPDGSLALTTGGEGLLVIDVSDRTLAETPLIMTGAPVAGLAITSDGARAVVTNAGTTGMVRLIDIASRSVIEHPLGLMDLPGPVAITPNGLAFVLEPGNETIEVVDVTGWTQTGQAILLTNTKPSNLAITPDGTLALVLQSQTNTVAVIDVSTLQVEADPIPVGSGPTAIAVSADSRFALVTNGSDGTLSVIDIPGRRALPGPLPTGPSPNSVALAPNGTAALVANAGVEYLTMF
jgi:YVTN family beta-propeller protein